METGTRMTIKQYPPMEYFHSNPLYVFSLVNDFGPGVGHDPSFIVYDITIELIDCILLCYHFAICNWISLDVILNRTACISINNMLGLTHVMFNRYRRPLFNTTSHHSISTTYSFQAHRDGDSCISYIFTPIIRSLYIIRM